MTGVGDGVSRIEELEAEFEAYWATEDADDREIGDHDVRVNVKVGGVKRYRCRRCDMVRTMTVHDFETSSCETDPEKEEQPVTDGGTAGEFEPGDRAVDREESPDRQTPVVVVAHHDTEAREYHVEAAGATVYLLNQQYGYPPDATVVDVVYEPALDEALDVGGEADLSGAVLRQIVDDHDLTTYSFPQGRLERINNAEVEA